MSDLSSDLCSSDLALALHAEPARNQADEGQVGLAEVLCPCRRRAEPDDAIGLALDHHRCADIGVQLERPVAGLAGQRAPGDVVEADRATGLQSVPAIAQEIGRASCRERVCQYV